MGHDRTRTVLAVIAGGLVCLSSGACNIVAPVAYAIQGPGKVEAQWTLDPAQTTVVFIDDPASKVGHRRARTELAETATNALLAKGVVSDMIDPRGAMTVASKERHGEAMSVSEIGRAAGARIVVYALLTEYTLSSDGVSSSPACTMRVKVIDTETGQRLWPADARGEVVSLTARTQPGQGPQTASDRIASEQALAARAGLALAQVFYTHEVTESVLR